MTAHPGTGYHLHEAVSRAQSCDFHFLRLGQEIGSVGLSLRHSNHVSRAPQDQAYCHMRPDESMSSVFELLDQEAERTAVHSQTSLVRDFVAAKGDRERDRVLLTGHEQLSAQWVC